MSTLYKRANPMQERMLKIVSGAVKNVFDAHPQLYITDRNGPVDRDRFARSISKRAIGTLSSQLDEVLALNANGVIRSG